MWDECNCAVVWAFFGIAFLWNSNENWHFPVLWPLLSFPHLQTYWVQHSLLSLDSLDPVTLSYLSLTPTAGAGAGGRGPSGGGGYRFQSQSCWGQRSAAVTFDLKVKTAPQTASINISILSSQQPILGTVSFAKYLWMKVLCYWLDSFTHTVSNFH